MCKRKTALDFMFSLFSLAVAGGCATLVWVCIAHYMQEAWSILAISALILICGFFTFSSFWILYDNDDNEAANYSNEQDEQCETIVEDDEPLVLYQRGENEVIINEV